MLKNYVYNIMSVIPSLVDTTAIQIIEYRMKYTTFKWVQYM